MSEQSLYFPVNRESTVRDGFEEDCPHSHLVCSVRVSSRFRRETAKKPANGGIFYVWSDPETVSVAVVWPVLAERLHSRFRGWCLPCGVLFSSSNPVCLFRKEAIFC